MTASSYYTEPSGGYCMALMGVKEGRAVSVGLVVDRDGRARLYVDGKVVHRGTAEMNRLLRRP